MLVIKADRSVFEFTFSSRGRTHTHAYKHAWNVSTHRTIAPNVMAASQTLFSAPPRSLESSGIREQENRCCPHVFEVPFNVMNKAVSHCLSGELNIFNRNKEENRSSDTQNNLRSHLIAKELQRSAIAKNTNAQVLGSNTSQRRIKLTYTGDSR